MIENKNNQKRRNSSYEIKNLFKHTNNNYAYYNLDNNIINKNISSSNLNNFNFKLCNKEIKNFTMYENFAKCDINNKKTNKRILNQPVDLSLNINKTTGEAVKLIDDKKNLKVNRKNLTSPLKVENQDKNGGMTYADNPCVYNYLKTRGKIEQFNILKRKKHFV